MVLRRMGRVKDALNVTGALYDAGHRDEETLALLGSAWSGLYDETGDVLHLRRSRDLYLRAYEVNPKILYYAINAAAKSLFLGENDVAYRIVDTALPELPEFYQGPRQLAFKAELFLIQKKLDAARELFQGLIDSNFEDVSYLYFNFRQAEKICKAIRLSERETEQVLKPYKMLEPNIQSLSQWSRTDLRSLDPNSLPHVSGDLPE